MKMPWLNQLYILIYIILGLYEYEGIRLLILAA